MRRTTGRTGARATVLRIACAVLVTVISNAAAAYTQDIELERQINASDPRGLARLPAWRFEDGVAGFFRTHQLYVVPDTVRAWCQDRGRGVLEPGCYVEFFFQVKGYRARETSGLPCGLIGRWRRAPDAREYVPTPGAIYARAMATGDWQAVQTALSMSSEPLAMHDAQRRDECMSHAM